MQKTAIIRANTEPHLKNDVEKIFKNLGLTSSEAINMFYIMVKLNNGFPFVVKIPNKATIKSFRDSEQRKNIKKF